MVDGPTMIIRANCIISGQYSSVRGDRVSMTEMRTATTSFLPQTEICTGQRSLARSTGIAGRATTDSKGRIRESKTPPPTTATCRTTTSSAQLATLICSRSQRKSTRSKITKLSSRKSRIKMLQMIMATTGAKRPSGTKPQMIRTSSSRCRPDMGVSSWTTFQITTSCP